MSYRPKIKPEQMKDLYFIKEYTSAPISMLVDDALRAYIPRFLNWIRRDQQLRAEKNKEVTL
jgi:hypothetical protein